MSTIHLLQTTTATPEQFVAGLTDFGPGRAELFENSADDYLKVHELAADHADVTEGSGGVWERLHYDWSDPGRVVITTTDSNVWGGASGYVYRLTRELDATTDIHATIVRDGKNLKGRLLGLVLGTRQARPDEGVRRSPRPGARPGRFVMLSGQAYGRRAATSARRPLDPDQSTEPARLITSRETARSGRLTRPHDWARSG